MVDRVPGCGDIQTCSRPIPPYLPIWMKRAQASLVSPSERGSTRQAASQRIKEIEARGYVTTVPDPEDEQKPF